MGRHPRSMRPHEGNARRWISLCLPVLGAGAVCGVALFVLRAAMPQGKGLDCPPPPVGQSSVVPLMLGPLWGGLLHGPIGFHSDQVRSFA